MSVRQIVGYDPPRRFQRCLGAQRRMAGRQPHEPDDHNEDDETAGEEKPNSAPSGNRRPRFMRVLLPQHIVPVEVPRPKAHRVEPVLPSMSVSGHGRAVLFLCRLARRHAATRRQRNAGSRAWLEECTGTPRRARWAWAWADVEFRPLVSSNLVPSPRARNDSVRPVHADPGPSGGPWRSPANGSLLLGWVAVGRSGQPKGYRVFPSAHQKFT
jgi:hypothetical protein